MGRPPSLTTRERLDRLFSVKATTTEGVIRRLMAPLLRHLSMGDLKAEVSARGFRMVQVGKYLVIFCSPEPVTVEV
jgi:hypothetical protein